MGDEVSTLILEHLRYMRGKIDRLEQNSDAQNVRIASIERILAGHTRWKSCRTSRSTD